MFNLLKELWSWIKNKKVISKIKNILDTCDGILEEKGYHDQDEHYKIKDHKLYVNIHYYKGKIDGLRFNSITSTMVLIFNFTTLTSLLDISLDIYCWCCLLSPLQKSRYQQYKRMCNVYVSNEQNSSNA